MKDRKLATIIGGPTAGTNGNIVTFTTPGGFAITFTGMRVTGHDGRAQHHMVGIAPTSGSIRPWLACAPGVMSCSSGHSRNFKICNCARGRVSCYPLVFDLTLDFRFSAVLSQLATPDPADQAHCRHADYAVPHPPRFIGPGLVPGQSIRDRCPQLET